jgi:hypothetical protein
MNRGSSEPACLIRSLNQEIIMARGRPKGDEPTCVLAVRVPVTLREELDRYLDALETRIGLKASRNEIIRHAVRRFLEDQQGEAWPRPPQGLREP